MDVVMKRPAGPQPGPRLPGPPPCVSSAPLPNSHKKSAFPKTTLDTLLIILLNFTEKTGHAEAESLIFPSLFPPGFIHRFYPGVPPCPVAFHLSPMKGSLSIMSSGAEIQSKRSLESPGGFNYQPRGQSLGSQCPSCRPAREALSPRPAGPHPSPSPSPHLHPLFPHHPPTIRLSPPS